LTKKR